jgi:hypothetical protein
MEVTDFCIQVDDCTYARASFYNRRLKALMGYIDVTKNHIHTDRVDSHSGIMVMSPQYANITSMGSTSVRYSLRYEFRPAACRELT